jgi:hypothetical protein
MSATTEDVSAWRWFLAWAVVGAGFLFGLIALPLLLVAAVPAAIMLARHQHAGFGSLAYSPALGRPRS